MPTKSQCPHCGTVVRPEKGQSGSWVRCGQCETSFVPSAGGPPDPGLSARSERHAGKAIASLAFGCFGLLAWVLPILGLPVTITGLSCGLVALHSRKHGFAVAGVTLSIIGLALTLANGAFGAFLAVTGQHSLFQ